MNSKQLFHRLIVVELVVVLVEVELMDDHNYYMMVEDVNKIWKTKMRKAEYHLILIYLLPFFFWLY